MLRVLSAHLEFFPGNGRYTPRFTRHFQAAVLIFPGKLVNRGRCGTEQRSHCWRAPVLRSRGRPGSWCRADLPWLTHSLNSCGGYRALTRPIDHSPRAAFDCMSYFCSGLRGASGTWHEGRGPREEYGVRYHGPLARTLRTFLAKYTKSSYCYAPMVFCFTQIYACYREVLPKFSFA